MNINRMAPVQQHSFFYLMNHYNTAIIGFSKGKSTAYLASIFSLILNNSNDNQTNNIGIRPKAIILSSSLGSCSDLEYLSKIFNNATHKTKQIKVVVAYSFISESKIIGTLLNGCDILITTPTTLVNIINKTKSLFHWKNLKHVVFDNIDLMLTSYEDQMPCLLSYLLKFKNKSNDIQFISSSVSWSKDIDNFLNQLFVKWQYIFGSHLEATRYMQIGFSLVQVQNDKLEKILEFLKNNIKYRKCVLLTSNTSELDIIYDYIKQNSSDIEVLLPGPLKCSFVYTVQKWYLPLEKNQLIFICSDEMMFDFYIDNADCLIHYDIPVEKSSFSIRFSVLQDPNNIFTEKERSSYIFLSDNSKDMIQLPKIVDIMQTFGRVEPILLKYTKIIKERLEELKKNSIFCYNIEKFGICPNSTTCKYRHVLLKENYKPNDNIPRLVYISLCLVKM
ncbi:Hypothetical protein CINCED_3A001557 [Cinara cedri]|nr:Hypothetical protein CINCED_3A001557 [Cinara cedri]